MNRAILLVVRSVEYRNLPLGVIGCQPPRLLASHPSVGARGGRPGAAPTGACGVPQARPAIRRHRAWCSRRGSTSPCC